MGADLQIAVVISRVDEARLIPTKIHLTEDKISIVDCHVKS